MDLKNLVNSDTAASQIDSRYVTNIRQTENAASTQTQQRYAGDARSVQDNGPMEYTTYLNDAGNLHPPTITTQPLGHYSQSINTHGHQQSPPILSPYQPHQQTPLYGAPHGHYSRPPSQGRDRTPITPLQCAQHVVSPSPSHRSYTGQSAQQSPMPTIQYGLPSQAGRAVFASPGSRQYEAQPLGPPPQRRSTEYATITSAADRYGKDDRKQSESVSPKTVPRTELSYGSRQSSMHEELSMTNAQHVNSQPQRAVQVITASVTPERPPFRRSQTMEMSNLLTPVEPSTNHLDRPAVHDMSASASPASAPLAQDGNDRKKRALEHASAEMPVAKKERIMLARRYHERPAWAVYSVRNRKAAAGGLVYNGSLGSGKPHTAEQRSMNGRHASSAPTLPAGPNLHQPWRDPVPYDTDLIKAREILGPWEKTFVWNTPLPDMLRTLQDWFYKYIQQYDAIVREAFGTLEIEAKLGRLTDIKRRAAVELPIMNMTIVQPSACRDYRFESALALEDFKKVNEFLNDASVKSNQPGRQLIRHARVGEEDSFAELSQAGLDNIPQALHQALPPGRVLKLRSTTNVMTGKITARIVKVPLVDLHIYNPSGYDCRISMNAEIDMMRDGLYFEELVVPSRSDAPAQPNRRKDRMSYKHLAYEVDITNVIVNGGASYEMELEVDAQVLSDQVRLISEQKPHAFGDVVSGFFDNVVFLMRLG